MRNVCTDQPENIGLGTRLQLFYDEGRYHRTRYAVQQIDLEICSNGVVIVSILSLNLFANSIVQGPISPRMFSSWRDDQRYSYTASSHCILDELIENLDFYYVFNTT